jgi:hypothetical protein
MRVEILKAGKDSAAYFSRVRHDSRHGISAQIFDTAGFGSLSCSAQREPPRKAPDPGASPLALNGSARSDAPLPSGYVSTGVGAASPFGAVRLGAARINRAAHKGTSTLRSRSPSVAARLPLACQTHRYPSPTTSRWVRPARRTRREDCSLDGPKRRQNVWPKGDAGCGQTVTSGVGKR